MKHLFLTVTAATALVTACTPAAKQKSGNNEGAVDPNLKTKVVFALPDISSLKAGDKAASDVMTDYLFTITEVQGSCAGVDAKTHKPLNLAQVDTISSANLAATIPANCDYEVQLSLGQGGHVHSDTELALDATATKATYNKDVKSIVSSKCISCHKGASASAGVDLSTDSGVKQYKSSIVSTVNGGSPVMPPSGSTKLTSSEKNVFNAWKSNGYAMGDDSEPSTGTATDDSSNNSSKASLEKVFYWNKTPLTLSKSELQKYKTYSAVLELKVTTEGKTTGFTTTTLKTIQEKLESNNKDTNSDTQNDPDDEADTETPTDTSTSTSGTVSYKDVQSLIQNRCVNCHPGQGQSDLSTYAKFKASGSASIDRILSGNMPKYDSFTAAQKELFKKWRDAGYPETASATTTNTNTSTAADGTVEFRIAAGTGSRPWNSPSEPLKLKVGQKLKIINDDSTAHWLHTDGAPCGHGNNMPAKGGSYTCVLSRAFSGDLHDHLYASSGFFYIEVSK